jgi:hypothetical protein
MDWASWAAAMRLLMPTRNCDRATMSAEQDFPSPADGEESRCQSFQDDQDDSIVLDSAFITDFYLCRLHGIEHEPLSAEAAEPMANHGRESYVDGLIAPSDEAAKALSQRGGVLFPLGDSALSGESKEGVNDSVVIYLDNHVDNSDSGDSSWFGRQMCQGQGEHFSYEEVEHHAYEEDEHLGAPEWPEDHHLTLSVETARKLANESRELSFSSLSELSPDAAKALAQHKGRLYLDGLTTISPEVAEALAHHKGELLLRELTTLSDEAAKALAQTKGYLYLTGPIRLSDEAAAALRANPKIKLPEKFR